jgi:hypothetical protein
MAEEKGVPRPFERWALVLVVLVVVGARLSLPAPPGSSAQESRRPAQAPQAVTEGRFYADSDATIWSYYPDGNYGSNTTLHVSWDDATKVTRCALLHFNITSIPTDSTILSAQVNLQQIFSGGEASVLLSLYRVESGWSEGAVTWATAPTPGPGLAQISVSSSPGIKSWMGLATQVQTWLAGGNYGFMLCGPASTGWPTYLRSFDSDESAGARPALIVQYNDPHLTLTPTATGTGTRTATATGTGTRTATATGTHTATATATRTGTPFAGGERCYLPLVRK